MPKVSRRQRYLAEIDELLFHMMLEQSLYSLRDPHFKTLDNDIRVFVELMNCIL
jgi:hypothetical protein